MQSCLNLEALEKRVLLSGVAPSVVDPSLTVRSVVEGLDQPTTMAFLGNNSFFVLEKASGQVKHVVNGSVQGVVLDLAVNSGSERGLLGIALHPNFSSNGFVYLYWTESSTVDDTNVLSETSLLGNRVDRFVWNGTSLTQDINIIRLRAIQQDADQPERGNHDGGVLEFGPDGKLYIYIGDVGRRGQMQNLPNGPFGPGIPDDQFGGPEPDNAHLTGVILRLNDNGTTPTDNPFFRAGQLQGGEVGANIQKVFAYGIRNGFGMAFNPRSGQLWDAQNGDDSFTELNVIPPGSNLGWIQVMGPVNRVAQFKAIETSNDIDPVTNSPYFGLQQVRWSPTNIADTSQQALSRMFHIFEGNRQVSKYVDPVFSWKFEVAPGGMGFMEGNGLTGKYKGDLFVGAARTFLEGGNIFHFKLTGNGKKIVVNDQRLKDGVADNNHKFDITESESLLFGRNFGISTDIQTGPNGNLFVVSLSNGAVYEILRRPPGQPALEPSRFADATTISSITQEVLQTETEDDSNVSGILDTAAV